MSEPVITARQLNKEFVRDEFHVVALKEVDIDIAKGEFVALMGPSGSGKSTLLHLIAAMDYPTGGEIRVLGHNLRELNDRQIARWRNENVGFIFQSFNLIPVLTALENVELPLKLTNLKKQERLDHAATALKLVGLGDRMGHYPRQLSGGQEQRVPFPRYCSHMPARAGAGQLTCEARQAARIKDRLWQEGELTFRKTVIPTHNQRPQYVYRVRG